MSILLPWHYTENAVSKHYRKDESVAFPNLHNISLICFLAFHHASHFTSPFKTKVLCSICFLFAILYYFCHILLTRVDQNITQYLRWSTLQISSLAA